MEVEEIILNTEGADLALVKVEGEINTQIFTPICLPGKGDERQSSEGVIAGWGRNSDNTDPGQNLKVIQFCRQIQLQQSHCMKELTVPIPATCSARQEVSNAIVGAET